MIIAKDAVVIIDYAIKDTEGTLLEDSDDGPMSFIQGTGVLVPGLEQALEGKKAGDRLQATLTPEEAFGTRDEELVLEVGLDDFQDPEEVVVGLNFQAEINNEIRFCTVESIT
ncbi:MAG: FKBP-type peptidyl-prolyl cis-trans isomerase, partial [Spirochaetaceae bacterium]|nr:FKBP-type peptidyl-prolyl cis-trans isomerase [Spirochaetaceae bacterium]